MLLRIAEVDDSLQHRLTLDNSLHDDDVIFCLKKKLLSLQLQLIDECCLAAVEALFDGKGSWSRHWILHRPRKQGVHEALKMVKLAEITLMTPQVEEHNAMSAQRIAALKKQICDTRDATLVESLRGVVRREGRGHRLGSASFGADAFHEDDRQQTVSSSGACLKDAVLSLGVERLRLHWRRIHMYGTMATCHYNRGARGIGIAVAASTKGFELLKTIVDDPERLIDVCLQHDRELCRVDGRGCGSATAERLVALVTGHSVLLYHYGHSFADAVATALLACALVQRLHEELLLRLSALNSTQHHRIDAEDKVGTLACSIRSVRVLLAMVHFNTASIMSGATGAVVCGGNTVDAPSKAELDAECTVQRQAQLLSTALTLLQQNKSSTISNEVNGEEEIGEFVDILRSRLFELQRASALRPSSVQVALADNSLDATLRHFNGIAGLLSQSKARRATTPSNRRVNGCCALALNSTKTKGNGGEERDEYSHHRVQGGARTVPKGPWGPIGKSESFWE